MAQNIYAHTNAYTLHTAPFSGESKVEIGEGQRDATTGFREMRILAVEYQQHHVLIDICIQNEIFSLTAVIDSGADVNILNTKVIPAKYWVAANRKVIGLGNKILKYEVPKASICFDHHCIKLKFVVADIPVDCILGNVFLGAVEPHGYIRLKGNKAEYFITVPTSHGPPKRIEIPYVSSPRVSTMVQAMQELDISSISFLNSKS